MNPIEELVDELRVDNFAAAGPMFHEIMASKLRDAIDAEQISVASEIFGVKLDDDEEQDDDEDLDDDEDFDDEDEE